MNKIYTVSMLKSHGYNAELVDGVVMVYSKDECYNAVKNLLREVGYTASWGIRKVDLYGGKLQAVVCYEIK